MNLSNRLNDPVENDNDRIGVTNRDLFFSKDVVEGYKDEGYTHLHEYHRCLLDLKVLIHSQDDAFLLVS